MPAPLVWATTPLVNGAALLRIEFDVTTAEVKAFIDKLPKDRISDSPIRVADVGGYKVGVYGVFRPKALPGGAIAHDTSVTEIYYMLEGTGTLVTGGTLVDRRSTGVSPNTGRQNYGGGRIDGGSSRQVVPGDRVEFHMTKLNHKRNFWWYRGEAKVDGVLCCEAEISAMMIIGAR